MFYSETWHKMHCPHHSKPQRSPQSIPTLNEHCKVQVTSIITQYPVARVYCQANSNF